jgi:hypothetical protein
MALLLDTSTGHVCRLQDYVWDPGLFCHRLVLVTMTGAAIWRTSHQVEVLPTNVVEFPGRALPASVVGSPADAMSRNTPLPVQTHPAGRGNTINELA